MKKFALFALILSMLASAIECVAQKKQAFRLLMGKGSLEIIKAARNAPDIRFKLPGGASQWGVPGSLPVIPQNFTPHDSLLLYIMPTVSLPSPAELLQRRQEALLQKAKKQLEDVYQKRRAEMEQGKALRDTLAWVRLGNKAAELGLDSIATDCVVRFLSYWPSIPKIATAVDSLMDSSQPYARAILEIYTDIKFYKYWENPDSTKIGISDFEILAELGLKYMCYHTDLALGMIYYLKGDNDAASNTFMRAADYAIEFPDSMPEIWNTLFRVTAYCMSMAGRYSDMITFLKSTKCWSNMWKKIPI